MIYFQETAQQEQGQSKKKGFDRNSTQKGKKPFDKGQGKFDKGKGKFDKGRGKSNGNESRPEDKQNKAGKWSNAATGVSGVTEIKPYKRKVMSNKNFSCCQHNLIFMSSTFSLHNVVKYFFKL